MIHRREAKICGSNFFRSLRSRRCKSENIQDTDLH